MSFYIAYSNSLRVALHASGRYSNACHAFYNKDRSVFVVAVSYNVMKGAEYFVLITECSYNRVV
jgi:hypothetical protein